MPRREHSTCWIRLLEMYKPPRVCTNIYTAHGDPVNNIDPSGNISLGGMLGAISIGSGLAAVYIPAIGNGFRNAYHVEANGMHSSILAAIFTGSVTRDDFIRAFDGFVDGGTAGLANLFDTLTFRQVNAIHQYRNAQWQRADLDNSWIGTASNAAAWTGTITGYAGSGSMGLGCRRRRYNGRGIV